MRRVGVLVLLTACLGLAAGVAEGANRLGGQPSPFLAMHAADPVDWQLWGPEVLARARREGKLILVSTGYFACHWCHVMQRESFQDPEVAAYLNRHFIPVKVDRELLPALDAALIRFVSRTGGRAGWPLNAFLTPAGHPLFGVGYLPRNEFLGMLRRLQERWTRDAKSLAALAEAGTRELAGPPSLPAALGSAATGRLADHLTRETLAAGDDLAGGFGHENKFPASPQLLALLELQRRKPDPELAAFLRLTLDQMDRLGLRDRLAGGFFRYTVDPDWRTPHFEKMLYDNALLAEVYRQAAEVHGEPRYGVVSRNTLDFLLEAMTDPSGGFVGSLSAVDAAGVEGGHYLWTDDQLREDLSDPEWRVVRLAWGMEGPAPEGGRLPVMALDARATADRLGLSPAVVTDLLESARRKLLAVRAKRSLPRDVKVIVGWNGLALVALARAGAQPDGERYRQAGAGLAEILKTRLASAEGLPRAFVNGRPTGESSLEDYAYAAAGLMAWTETSGDRAAQTLAARLVDSAWRRFRTPSGWRLGEGATLPFGDAEPVLADGYTPSPSAVLLRVSLQVAERTGDDALRRRALDALRRDYPPLTESPLLHASHILLLAQARRGATDPVPASGRSATD